jgi:hypothetical protein
VCLCEQTTPPCVQVREQRGGQGIAGMCTFEDGTACRDAKRGFKEGRGRGGLCKINGRLGEMQQTRGHSRGERGIAWEGSPHLGRGLALPVAVVSHGPEDLMQARGGALESYVKKSTAGGRERGPCPVFSRGKSLHLPSACGGRTMWGQGRGSSIVLQCPAGAGTS